MRSDLELLEAWRGGDRAAAGELFDRHAESIYRFFANKVDRDVEDLVQITLMACVKGRDRVADGAHFRAYLFGAARNVLRTYLYKRGRMREDADLGVSSICDLGVGPSTLIAAHEEQRLLLEALRSIPVESQLLLELRYWEELSTEELALVFGVPAGTIKSRLSRARKRLERALSELHSAGAVLESTRTNLDAWAAGLRDQVSRIVASR
ncbi:MAG: sigma-70 family RNA polymerase sigma factor [Myxococcales bacterium]|nr:sigma-70 family RNA polymerase sigma factor [Myxococcales bacterium]